MKKTIKHIFILLFAVTAMLALSVTALAADASVTYEGGAEKFVFLPGSSYTDSDLFGNFKDVMPGDTVTQKITVKNDYRGCDFVNIFMRAEAHDESGNPLSEKVESSGETVVAMNDFLSRLSMTVYSGDKVIYQASPEELDGLADNVLIACLEQGKSMQLTVELQVPAELGNEYANRVGEVDWIFLAEEGNRPAPTPTPAPALTPTPAPASTPVPAPNVPGTGDDTIIVPYIAILTIVTCGLVILLLMRRKKQRKK